MFRAVRFRAFLSSGRRTVPLPEGGEQAAGRLNVLAPRGADRRRDASPRQLIAQTDHRRFVGSLERSVGNRVEADQVDPAAEPCEQPRQRGDVRRRIVDSAKDDVFEADSALMREVVPPQLGDHLLDRIAALGGHHGCALGGDRVVQADGQMHPGPSQQLPHGGNHADRRHGDPRRAPAVSPVGGQHLDRSDDLLRVVERLAHAHVDDVGQPVAFGNRADLIQYLPCGQVVRETLPRGHAETAAHPAARLRRDAERRPVTVGDVGRLDEAALQSREKVFFRAVGRSLHVGEGNRAQLVFPGELLPVLQREVRHPADRIGSLAVQPRGDLPRGEPGHPVLGGDPLQFVEREAEQPRLVGRYGGIFHRSSIRSWFSGVFLRADIPARPRGESRSVRSRRGIPPLR